jgi:uncharacterized membrane protein YidH (DUF202 family)
MLYREWLSGLLFCFDEWSAICYERKKILVQTLHATDNAGAWVTRFAKVGLTAKGIVYCLLGVLAFMAAFEIGDADKNAGSAGVFNLITQQPFGKVILAAVAIGLVCYTIWRFIQAFKDTEHKGDGAKGYGKRIAYFLSGLAYAALAFSAAKFLFTNKQEEGDQQQEVARELLSNSFGQMLATVVALILIGIGIFQLYLALSGKYKKHVQKNNLDAKAESLMLRTGMLGYISRGLVWLIVGGMFLKAAWSANSNEAGDTNRAFHWIESSDYGSYLLAAIALGLICYGLFMLVRARYQPVRGK